MRDEISTRARKLFNMLDSDTEGERHNAADAWYNFVRKNNIKPADIDIAINEKLLSTRLFALLEKREELMEKVQEKPKNPEKNISTSMHRLVYELYCGEGPEGCVPNLFLAKHDLKHESYRPRISELRRAGKLVSRGQQTVEHKGQIFRGKILVADIHSSVAKAGASRGRLRP